MFEGLDWAQIAAVITPPSVPISQSNFTPPPMMPAPPQVPISQSNFTPPSTPNMESPVSPEFLAKNMAARGILPPPVDIAPGDVGAALTGTTVPMPMARPTMGGGGAPSAPMDITSDAQKAGEGTPKPGGSMMDALKGVKAPAAPEVQRISSPSAPRPTTQIKGGDIIALLQSLSQGKQGGLDLPSTLGQALMRR